MLSPLELLDIAQDLAARIPRTSDFSEERNVSWLAVGIASLVMDDINKAQRALENLDSIRVQARLSLDIGKWAGKHADSEVGRKILDETVSQFSTRSEERRVGKEC